MLDLYLSTLRALIAPRRLIPFFLVVIPLLYAQVRVTDDWGALPLGTVMCLAFFFLAPFLWRVFLPRDDGRVVVGLKLLAYGLCGALTVWVVGVVAPNFAGVPMTFMTAPTSLGVVLGLFCAGGWGLGRDVEHERRLHDATARAERVKSELDRAQVLAIQSHLDPHFLFNTLNAIAEWCRDDPQVAEAAILKLSDLLRTILEGIKTGLWPLEREMALVRGVAELHRIRDPGAFEFIESIDSGCRGVHIPPLLLLPVIENAMKHGPGRGCRGNVELDVSGQGRWCRVSLSNPGTFTGPRQGGDGLELVTRRLAMAYPGDGTFCIEERNGRTVAELCIPVS